MSFDLKTRALLKREADRSVIAVTYNAFYSLEKNGDFICQYDNWNGSGGIYKISSGNSDADGILPYKEKVTSPTSLCSIDGACYYNVRDWAKKTCCIREVSPDGEQVVVDIGGYGYDSAIALYARKGTVWFEIGLQDRPLLSATGMMNKGIVKANISSSTIYDVGKDLCAVRYIYLFDNTLVYYGIGGNIYCENTAKVELQGHPAGFSIITEPHKNYVGRKIL